MTRCTLVCVNFPDQRKIYGKQFSFQHLPRLGDVMQIGDNDSGLECAVSAVGHQLPWGRIKWETQINITPLGEDVLTSELGSKLEKDGWILMP